MGRPIIGIAQTGSDLSRCNRHHLDLAKRVREGIREAGGIAFEVSGSPDPGDRKATHRCARPQPAYLGLVEMLYGYPLDGVVLTSAATDHTGLPHGGCNGQHPGDRSIRRSDAQRLVPGPARVGNRRSGTARNDGGGRTRLCRPGQAGCVLRAVDRLLQHDGHGVHHELARRSAGHAASGSAAIPAPHRDRQEMAYLTGKRAVEIVNEDLKPSDILTREAFINAIPS